MQIPKQKSPSLKTEPIGNGRPYLLRGLDIVSNNSRMGPGLRNEGKKTVVCLVTSAGCWAPGRRDWVFCWLGQES